MQGRMRASVKFMALAVSLWLATAHHPAQASIGPFGGAVRNFAIHASDSGTIYAGTGGGGVFKSSDGGQGWSEANTGLTNRQIYALVMDPTDSNTLYAGAYGGGVFKSTDGGESWSAMNKGLTQPIVWSLVINPQDPRTLYVSIGGVYKSTNGGESWSAVKTGISDVRSLAVDPQDSNTVYAATAGNSVYASYDGGRTWY